MPRASYKPLAGLAAAIAITTTMDATGFGMFSALPLWPLAGLFWFLQKFSRREFGLTRGPARAYVLAMGYPVLVVGSLAAAAVLVGPVHTADADWGRAARELLLMVSTGAVALVLTEEGFFRGWLWAALTRTLGPGRRVLLISSLGFALWHISAVTLIADYMPPVRQVPVYLVNVVAMGLVWGLLRQRSGSLVVAAVSHSVWNGLAYLLFGFGTKVGVLGIADTSLWGVETGWFGLGANIGFLVLLSLLPAPAPGLSRA